MRHDTDNWMIRFRLGLDTYLRHGRCGTERRAGGSAGAEGQRDALPVRCEPWRGSTHNRPGALQTKTDMNLTSLRLSHLYNLRAKYAISILLPQNKKKINVFMIWIFTGPYWGCWFVVIEERCNKCECVRWCDEAEKSCKYGATYFI